MILFPPWKSVHASNGINAETPRGYKFILNPPKLRGNSYPKIDLTQLGLQITVVALIAGGLLVTYKIRPIKEETLK